MRITGVRLGLLRVPLRTPFVTALRTVDAVGDVIVLLDTDAGLSGHGSAAPAVAITGDSEASIATAIRGPLARAVLGRDPDDLDDACAAVQSALPGAPGAKAAVEIALHDLAAQARALPLHALLRERAGLPPAPAHVPDTDLTISVGTPAAMAADARAALARGFTVLKIKLGREPALDDARVRAVHAAVAGAAALRLDANQAWDEATAIALMQALEADGIRAQLLEQPVPARAIAALARVRAAIATPVMADEAVFDADDARRVLDAGAAAILNIKLAKAGGISGAMRIADLAAARGVACMVGCMLESPVGVAAAAHFAAARADVVTGVDLDPPALCTGNPVVGGARFDGPRIRLADAPGLGIVALPTLQPLAAD